ncbi:hypothetical protein NC652_026367 [Populus alba x Populus x berolinensis]|uniref:Uncharacterized protein n=1 Tax=Populus alba x Populus x berolinensis TaxID=444605 RepID=A0AAD6MCK0_9ROSI|nr:hypothetical protein NC652_026367 [Populus alba x Populus x berolinensis]KAJ6982984.1 hypothetical protein NC653_025948 [Populus alba x Populus x berolinensis]
MPITDWRTLVIFCSTLVLNYGSDKTYSEKINLNILTG